MKRSLKKIIHQHRFLKKDILAFYSKKGYSIDKISEFSSNSGIPLYVIYYLVYKKDQVEDAMVQLNRLCDYYDIEVDCE